MNTFFTQIAETMADRQEMRMHIKKVGNDLVVLAVPNFKEEGKHITVSGSPEDLNAGFIEEIKKPLAISAKTLISNAAEVAKAMEEEETEETAEPAKTETKKGKAKADKPDKKAAGKGKSKAEAKPAEPNVADVVETVANAKTPEPKKEETHVDPDPVEVEVETPEPEKQDIPEVEMEVEPDPEPQPEEEEDGPNPDELFEYFMNEGKRYFDDRKYKEAEEAYKKAHDLKPDDKKAKSDLDQASKWVRAIEKMNSK